MTNTDKLLNFLDEHDALHNFLSEADYKRLWFSDLYRPHVMIMAAFIWMNSIDGHDYWENICDKAREL